MLLDDLMRVMDIDSDNLKLKQESVNVAQVIDAALHASQSQFDEKGLRLITDIPEKKEAGGGGHQHGGGGMDGMY